MKMFLMNECYIWMQAHVSDRGILHFTVRFLLYEKTLFCQTGCYKACFVLFLKEIMIDLMRQFENNYYTCLQLLQDCDFIPTNEEACFVLCFGTVSRWLQY